MSLVAYDTSDEGSENEESESAEPVAANDTDNDAAKTITVQINSKLSLPAPKVVSQNKNVEVEENDSTESNFQLDMLPKPKDLTSTSNFEEEVDEILLKKETERQIPKPVKKQTVKISVPSLSEFKDIEEESEVKPAKIVQLPQRGCGLFSVLVPPKRETKSNKILIPQAVKNLTGKTNIQQSKMTKKANTCQNNSKLKISTLEKSHNELSSDEDDTSIDFFGLTENKDAPSSSTTELLDSELSLDLVHKRNTEDLNDESSNSSKILTSNVINLPKEEILLKNKVEVGPKLPIPEQEYNVDMEGNVAFDEKAIEYLCGKRGIKRKEIDGADIIEINGEDIKPDEREWLVKALTEESVHRPVSMQSSGGVNSQSKKKHQITYLAHQAKAMELELKNQWSQNRMARKQAKSKYGF
ncbi:hypothetical protein PUN28_001376 [Cardiocondyla obscurior]|uniref:Proline-rich protein PRCC n=1 Tax=Cardiocondyla obscurior TaxID=286306 RepID=A0AAW2H4R6_9HYME